MPSSAVGFPPVAGTQPRILVLGSFPGARSLHEREYYANPQNRFWRAIAEGVPIDIGAPYAARLEALKLAGIALWDVLHHCERRGSLDQSIVRGSEVPNDIGAFIEEHSSLSAILLNGRSAGDLFHRCILPHEYWEDSGLSIHIMPSTSPAHAAMRIEDVVNAWSGRIALR